MRNVIQQWSFPRT